MLVISCHADTGFSAHALSRLDGGLVHGHLDNYAGVYAVMKAYFSGRLNRSGVRVELTYGEEEDYAGAKRVLSSLWPHDIVIVVDVTGIETSRSFTIEKCADDEMKAFLERALAGLSFDLYPDSPDPIANEDESDVYREKCRMVAFLGIPCTGGDYNEGPVSCREQCLDSVAEALCRIVEHFELAREEG